MTILHNTQINNALHNNKKQSKGSAKTIEQFRVQSHYLETYTSSAEKWKSAAKITLKTPQRQQQS